MNTHFKWIHVEQPLTSVEVKVEERVLVRGQITPMLLLLFLWRFFFFVPKRITSNVCVRAVGRLAGFGSVLLSVYVVSTTLHCKSIFVFLGTDLIRISNMYAHMVSAWSQQPFE